MTTIELLAKIKTEIERLNNKMDDRDPLAPNQKAGYLFALADVLSFLSTLEESKKCDGCNNVKGCVTCVNGDQWAHYEESEKPMNLEKMEREEELKKAVHQVSEEIVKEIFPDDLESGDFFTEIDLKNCITRVAYQFADWGAEHLKK